MSIFKNRTTNRTTLDARNSSDGIYFKYQNIFMSAALALPEYENLPDTVNMRYCEQHMLTGQATAILEDERTGLIMSLPFQHAEARGFTVYGEPKRIYGEPASKFSKPFFSPRRIPSSKFAIIYPDVKDMPGINNGYTSRMDIIRYGAQLCWELENTFRLNVLHQNHPFLLYGTTNDKLSRANFWNNFQDYKPFVMVEKGIKIEEMLQTIDLKIPYEGTALLADISTVMDMTLYALGYPQGTTKQERQITSEVAANVFTDSAQTNSFMIPREEGVAKANELFGTNITVRPKPSPIANVQLSADMEIQPSFEEGGKANVSEKI